MDDFDWDRTVFTLLGPDALVRHLGGAVLDRIESLQYRPVTWRVFWHRPEDLDSFHEQQITHAWKTYLYRLVDHLFAFGPTVAMLVTDEQPGSARTSHQRLGEGKGSSDPASAGPGTIRGDLSSINVMLALMHSADTPADSRHESSIFGGPGGFQPGADPGDLRSQLSLLELAGPAEQRGYPEVLAGLRARMLAATWDDLPRPVRKTAGVMAEAGAGGLAAAGSGERLADLLPAAHPLADVLRADFTPGSPGPPVERVRLQLTAFGTDLDPWEDLVLATSRRFWPRGANANLAS